MGFATFEGGIGLRCLPYRLIAFGRARRVWSGPHRLKLGTVRPLGGVDLRRLCDVDDCARLPRRRVDHGEHAGDACGDQGARSITLGVYAVADNDLVAESHIVQIDIPAAGFWLSA